MGVHNMCIHIVAANLWLFEKHIHHRLAIACHDAFRIGVTTNGMVCNLIMIVNLHRKSILSSVCSNYNEGNHSFRSGIFEYDSVESNDSDTWEAANTSCCQVEKTVKTPQYEPAHVDVVLLSQAYLHAGVSKCNWNAN